MPIEMSGTPEEKSRSPDTCQKSGLRLPLNSGEIAAANEQRDGDCDQFPNYYQPTPLRSGGSCDESVFKFIVSVCVKFCADKSASRLDRSSR